MKGGMKHALMTRKMSLKTPIGRNVTADIEIEVTEMKIDLPMKKESMTPSQEILTTEAGAS